MRRQHDPSYTVLVASNGSFAEHHFVLYSLPNRNLAEMPDGMPVCDSSHSCVLYVGENQEDFTEPKVFSVPFSVAPDRGISADCGGKQSGVDRSVDSTSAVPVGHCWLVGSPAPAWPGVTSGRFGQLAGLEPGTSGRWTLAFTGMRPIVIWMLWIGSLMFLSGPSAAD